jgi:hypothetical protein
MTLHSRPNRRNTEQREAFVNQAAAADTAQLHCLIPADLHRQLRVKAALEDTNMTALVIAAIETFLTDQQ